MIGADVKMIWHLSDQWRKGYAYDETPVGYPARFRLKRFN